jgi:hypothetical protein
VGILGNQQYLTPFSDCRQPIEVILRICAEALLSQWRRATEEETPLLDGRHREPIGRRGSPLLPVGNMAMPASLICGSGTGAEPHAEGIQRMHMGWPSQSPSLSPFCNGYRPPITPEPNVSCPPFPRPASSSRKRAPRLMGSSPMAVLDGGSRCCELRRLFRSASSNKWSVARRCLAAFPGRMAIQTERRVPLHGPTRMGHGRGLREP